MDPLSIASAVIAFWEAALRLKYSIEKVGRIRQHTRGVLEDTFSAMVAIKDFCDTNALILGNDALVELKLSLEALTLNLLRICEECERAAPRKPVGRLWGLRNGYALWKRSDEIEADLLRLKESTQVWLDRTHLLVSARSELAIARIEHEALISLQDSRKQIRQIDDLFCQLVCTPGSQYSSIQVTASTELDDPCRQYVQLKMTSICEILMERPRAISVSPGAFATEAAFQVFMEAPPSQIPGKEFLVGTLVRRLSETWQAMLTASSMNFPTLSVADLFSDLAYFDFDSIPSRGFNYIIRDLHYSLQFHKRGPRRKELLFWLRCALVTHPNIRFADAKALMLFQDALTLRRELQLFPTTRHEALLDRLYHSTALQGCAMISYMNKDIASALHYIYECLETMMPCYQPGHPITPIFPTSTEGDNNLLYIATSSTVNVFSLYSAAFIHSAGGDYSLACRLGRDAISLIDGLKNGASVLPSNFDFLERECSVLRRNIPTWVNIPRNPGVSSHHITEIDEENEPEESEIDGYYIEWGIAV